VFSQKNVEERIELAHELRRRFRLSTSTLIDALDNRACRAFGRAPNVAMLVHLTAESPSSKPGSSLRKWHARSLRC